MVSPYLTHRLISAQGPTKRVAVPKSVRAVKDVGKDVKAAVRMHGEALDINIPAGKKKYIYSGSPRHRRDFVLISTQQYTAAPLPCQRPETVPAADRADRTSACGARPAGTGPRSAVPSELRAHQPKKARQECGATAGCLLRASRPSSGLQTRRSAWRQLRPQLQMLPFDV